MTTRKLGILEVSYDALHELLDLPSNVEVIDAAANVDDRHARRQIRIVLCGEGLPEVPEGNMLPVVSVAYEYGAGCIGKFKRFL